MAPKPTTPVSDTTVETTTPADGSEPVTKTVKHVDIAIETDEVDELELDIKGQKFIVPASLTDWNMEAQHYFREGEIYAAWRDQLGADLPRFAKLGLKKEQFVAVMQGLTAALGLGGTGE